MRLIRKKTAIINAVGTYYNYHGQIKKRIRNGELAAVVPSGKAEYAFVLVFKTFPYERPVRPSAAWRYADILEKIDGKNNL